MALALCALAGLELLTIGASLSLGSSSALPWDALLSGDLSETQRAILWGARAPRLALGAIAGAALASGGVAFQAVLRNPLADPYILGVAGGGALGATALMATGATLSPTIGSFAGALVALGLLLGARRLAPAGRAGIWALLLAGVLFNAFASSLITLLKSIVRAEKAQELLFYLMGSLSVGGVTWWTLAWLAALVGACTATLCWIARDLNALSLGDDEACALGVDPERARLVAVVAASLGVAAAVAYTGLIGFVGLVVPHALRLVLGPDNRLLVPASALAGGACLIGCDALARATFDVASTTLPVGVVTALLGAPAFAALMWVSARRGELG